jgi:arylsulfatase A-like enzyme
MKMEARSGRDITMKMVRWSFLACLCLGIAHSGAAEKPNILFLLADDLGWSDLGCYGGEIRTPNLDSLAQGGLRFTQFYNSARCSPTRAAILTGLHPHQAGFPNLSGVLSRHCVTIPEVLKGAGYRTYMVGKWHLSRQSTPTQRGFEEFYGMLGGFNTCWKEDPFYTRLPEGRVKRTYAPGEFYSTDVFRDYALDFMEDGRKSGQPWFLYLAFNAAHFPLHAWQDDIAKYETLYAQGWDKIREQRLARQKELGLVPKDLTLTPRSNIPANQFNVKTGWADKDNPAWDSLPADRRADLARRMAVYAAMVDRMDQAVGRIVTWLKETGQFDKTIIFFLSDNGACAEWDPWGFDEVSGPKNILHTGEDLKKVGGPDSYVSYGSAWANACNTPFRLYKHYGHEGGINTPLIIHWPAGLKTKPGAITRQAGHITDFMPTILELAGASYPQEREGQKVLPPEGVSLAPVLRGEHLAPRRIFMEHEGNRAVREGRWKLVALKDKPWELYDIEVDPTEMNDLAAREKDPVARLAQAWDDWADRCSVRGQSSSWPQIANKPLTIACDVEARSRDGVILAQGGNQQGYALWLRDGQLVFGVRINGKLTSITTRETPSDRFAITARLGRGGVMQVVVNGREVASGRAPGLIPTQPVDELSIGQDTRTAVGDYAAPNPLRGKVENVRIVTE